MRLLKKLWLGPLIFVCYWLSPAYRNHRTFGSVWQEVVRAQDKDDCPCGEDNCTLGDKND